MLRRMHVCHSVVIFFIIPDPDSILPDFATGISAVMRDHRHFTDIVTQGILIRASRRAVNVHTCVILIGKCDQLLPRCAACILF